MTGTRNIRRVLSFGKGPFCRYAGIIIVIICVFAVPRAGADTTATAYTWPNNVVLSVAGGSGPVVLAEHLHDAQLAAADRERLYGAYGDTVTTANPYLGLRPSLAPETAWQDDRLPYVSGVAGADSAYIVFAVGSDDIVDGLSVFYLDGTVWRPVECTVDTATYALRARIGDDGFYAVLVLAGLEFGFDEYLSSYPNPFRPPWESAKITYLLEYDADVEIRICTRTGALVKTMNFAAGAPGGRGSGDGYYLNRVTWDGRNERGRLVEGGGYYCRLIVTDQYYLDWKIGVRR